MEFLLGLEWEQPMVDLLVLNLVNLKDEELVADLAPQKAQVLVDESALVLVCAMVCASVVVWVLERVRWLGKVWVQR
jgi:hypothetical protein